MIRLSSVQTYENFKEFPMSEKPTNDRIQQEVNDNDIVLFMKGSPVFPQCGFSAAVVQVLSELNVKFKGVDVLEDRVARHERARVEVAHHDAQVVRERRRREAGA